jgi:hypothetical protein
MEPSSETTRREVRRTVTNRRQPARKPGADRDPISFAAIPRSMFAPEVRVQAWSTPQNKIDY